VAVTRFPGQLRRVVPRRWQSAAPGATPRPVPASRPPRGESPACRATALALVVMQWPQPAGQRLSAALADVSGDAGPDVPEHALVVRGSPGRVPVGTADRESAVLVVGAGRCSLRHRALTPSVSRYCLAHTTCPGRRPAAT